jgi:hypothetical protein
MSGLFYDIQGYFKAKYSGRYLAFILAELFRKDPDAFIRVLNEAGINYTRRRGDSAIANHWPFPTKRRFADIAVLNAAGNPLVLIEIKDADITNENNAAQLDDYLEFIDEKKNQSVKFLFLSRSIPPENDELKLRTAKSKERVRSMFFRELHKPLRGSKIFGQMLLDYLEDIDVAYRDRKPDPKTISYVTNLMLGIGGRRATTEKSVPEFFEIAFGNLSSMGQWIQNNNPKLFKQGFKRRLYVKPWHDVRGLQDVMTAENQKKAMELIEAEVLDGYCHAGEVDFYACGYLRRKKTKVYLEFGYWSYADRKSIKPVTYKYSSGIYAYAQWKPWKATSEIARSDRLKSFPDEEFFQRTLRGYLRSVKAAAIARKNCPKDVKEVLREFNIP